MNMRWAKLTRGEKLVRVAVKLTRFALIAAVIAVVASIIIGAVLGLIVAFAMASAISGGLRNAGRANTNHLYGLTNGRHKSPLLWYNKVSRKGASFM